MAFSISFYISSLIRMFRICPGSHIGLSTLYLIAALILALFAISPEFDAEGKPIKVTAEFVSASLISSVFLFL